VPLFHFCKGCLLALIGLVFFFFQLCKRYDPVFLFLMIFFFLLINIIIILLLFILLILLLAVLVMLLVVLLLFVEVEIPKICNLLLIQLHTIPYFIRFIQGFHKGCILLIQLHTIPYFVRFNSIPYLFFALLLRGCICSMRIILQQLKLVFLQHDAFPHFCFFLSFMSL